MKTTERLMYLDQYQHSYFASSRKELIDLVSPHGKPRVSILYRDKTNGDVVRCGYVIGEHWLTAYKPVEIIINR